MVKKTDFADFTTKEEIFGVPKVPVTKRKKKKKKKKKKGTVKKPARKINFNVFKVGSDAAKQSKIGSVQSSTVKSHKRTSPGSLKKKKIKKFQRKARYWGPAKPIRVQLIYRIDLTHKLKNDKKAFEVFEKEGKKTFKTLEEMITYWKALPDFVAGGVLGGMNLYRKLYLHLVPQRSGRMREMLLNSLERNTPKPKKRFKFPYMMKVGVNLKYASVVDRYTPPVQIKHRAGDPRGNKGDPKAEFGFWQKFPKHLRDATELGMMQDASLRRMEYRKFLFFIKTTPKFL